MISPVLDNLTTALIMSAVILAVCAGNARFITLAFVNLVVAANAGGAWSAFGDITTLMVWQARKVEFVEFFLDLSAFAGHWLIPALAMSFCCAGRAAPSSGKPREDPRKAASRSA